MNSAIKRGIDLSQISSIQHQMDWIQRDPIPSILRQLGSVQTAHELQSAHQAAQDLARIDTFAHKAALADASRTIGQAVSPAQSHQLALDAKTLMEKALGPLEKGAAHSSLAAGVDAFKGTIAEQALAHDALKARYAESTRGLDDAMAMKGNMAKAVEPFAHPDYAQNLASGIDVGKLASGVEASKAFGAFSAADLAQRLEPSIDVRNALSAFGPTQEEMIRHVQLVDNAGVSKSLLTDFRSAQEKLLGVDAGRAAALFDPWKEEMSRRQAFIDAAGKDKFMAMNAASVASAASSFKDQAMFLSSVIEEASKAQGFVTNISADWTKKAQFADLGILSTDRAAIGAIISDTLQIGGLLGSAFDTAKDLAHLTPVFDSYAGLTNIYGDLHQERMAAIAHMPTITPHEMYGILLPTTSVQAYGRSVKHYVAAELGVDETPRETNGALSLGDLLERRLARLGGTVLQLRRGVWTVLSSNSEDKVSQATHSARELLRIVLEQLAPDDKVPLGSDGKRTRKSRLQYVLGKQSAVDYIDAMASAINLMYARLSAFAHHSKQAEESAIAVITACEALILDLLVSLD